MLFRQLSRRDAIWVMLGASFMHFYAALSPPNQPSCDSSIVIDTHLDKYQDTLSPDLDPLPPPPEPVFKIKSCPTNHPHHDEQGTPETVTATSTMTATTTITTTTTMILELLPSHTELPPPPMESPTTPIDPLHELPETSIVAHAPGWTIFRNLYMSSGTLFILSTNSSFPEIRLMTSTGLTAENTPENIAAREPTSQNMDFITPEEARQRWGGGDRNRVWSVEGNTLLFNDPSQFLRHYYHFVGELLIGTWSFWSGAFSTPSTSSLHAPRPNPPPIHRAIFAHSNADGWRDGPGFNAYFLRAAFPSLTVEIEEDWGDRIAATSSNDRAWHFPLVLLADRSAAHRGEVCGSQTQRTAAEAWELMKRTDRLFDIRAGGWWEPVRSAVLRFAGFGVVSNGIPLGGAVQEALGVADADTDKGGEGTEDTLSMPEKVVITYISRQSVYRRKLLVDDHARLIIALAELVDRKGSSWELNVLEAEKMTKDDQVHVIGRTTILLGVHGNGLTHLVLMPPTRVSTVIEILYPGAFVHDYHWTTRALGMSHIAVWNDTYYTYPNEPRVDYPEGFQGNSIPVYGPTVVQIIEDRVEGKI